MPGMQISPPPSPPKEICKIESFPSDSKIWNQKWNYKNWQYTTQAPAVGTETRANWIVSPSEKITQPFALGPPLGLVCQWVLEVKMQLFISRKKQM